MRNQDDKKRDCQRAEVAREVLYAYTGTHNVARASHRVQPLRRLGLAFVLILCTLPAACASGIKSKTVTWQEEVKLSTGEVIVVERETRFRPSGGEPFQRNNTYMTNR